ncbi:MAG TPA: hypothetical protein PKH60_05370 [Candidatus Woesebacteria bacterium]|nr:hypothetical protein [Candidatus Woesebacteria bacterium]
MAGLIGGISGGTSPETVDSLRSSQMIMREGFERKFKTQQAEIERLQDLYAVAQKEIQRLRKLPDENEAGSNYYEFLFWTVVIMVIIDKVIFYLAR